ncbi:MAG: hypothetical protein IJO81_03435 [Clostridia bacterium]|nr:hypothetical protein [Clostridia bacterium]
MRIDNNITDNTVYPIVIKKRGVSYLTLYYYTERGDAVLHDGGKNLIYFTSEESMAVFCDSRGLKPDGEVYEYDFDLPLENPIDYSRMLDRWNLLNTIAYSFGMYFEGNAKKYTPLYDLLFCLSTSEKPIPETYSFSEKHLKYITKVFRKKDRFLGRLELYAGN